MSMPDDDAGRKNVEALATVTFSDCSPEILAPTATRRYPCFSFCWYLNRRPSVRRAYSAAFLHVLLKQSLDCAFRAAFTLAHKRWGFEIETASSFNLQKEGV